MLPISTTVPAAGLPATKLEPVTLRLRPEAGDNLVDRLNRHAVKVWSSSLAIFSLLYPTIPGPALYWGHLDTLGPEAQEMTGIAICFTSSLYLMPFLQILNSKIFSGHSGQHSNGVLLDLNVAVGQRNLSPGSIAIRLMAVGAALWCPKGAGVHSVEHQKEWNRGSSTGA